VKQKKGTVVVQDRLQPVHKRTGKLPVLLRNSRNQRSRLYEFLRIPLRFLAEAAENRAARRALSSKEPVMGRSIRRWLALAACALLPLAWGCAHCASPYDYCGPVFNGGCKECVVDARVGSAFYAPEMAPGDVIVQAVPEGEPVAPPPYQPGEPAEESDSPSDTRPELGPAIPDRQTMELPGPALRR
jgi:hypothetical protein